MIPFGLFNTSSMCQVSMKDLLRPFLRKELVFYLFYEIIVFSSTLTKHINQLDQVFTILLSIRFYLKESKCLIAEGQLEYFGHVISHRRVQVNPSKIKATVVWPVPREDNRQDTLIPIPYWQIKKILILELISAWASTLASVPESSGYVRTYNNTHYPHF